MSTRMDGIEQPSLFAGKSLKMDVIVDHDNRYRVLAEKLPWNKLGKEANFRRSKKIDIHNGRPLNLRLHLAALIAQSMNGWTDRETEDMVAHHAGVRILCALEFSNETIDHTSIETFRNQLGKDGVEAINKIVVKAATDAGFTGTGLCSSDTTVQEAPIAYPTEVGHLRNIANKLAGIGLKIRKKLAEKLTVLSAEVHKTYTHIRLFARGKGEAVSKRRKKLSQQLRRTVEKMERLVRKKVNGLKGSSKDAYRDAMTQYRLMLEQIKHWMKTGFHRPGKLISLWNTEARAIKRNKAAKMTEFGRRWILTRLERGYTIGDTCKKLGGDADTSIMQEVLENFKKTMGALPEFAVYDRGGDGPANHKTLQKRGIRNGIFRKGRESQLGLGRNMARKARRERALSEAAIATIKQTRYGFNKPRAKTAEGCILKGHFAILGANLTRFVRDWTEPELVAA